MTTQDFICACLRCYKGACIYMDTLQESFDVALTEDDVRATLAINGEHLYNNAGRPLQIGNDLIARLLYGTKYAKMNLTLRGFWFPVRLIKKGGKQ